MQTTVERRNPVQRVQSPAYAIAGQLPLTSRYENVADLARITINGYRGKFAASTRMEEPKMSEMAARAVNEGMLVTKVVLGRERVGYFHVNLSEPIATPNSIEDIRAVLVNASGLTEKKAMDGWAFTNEHGRGFFVTEERGKLSVYELGAFVELSAEVDRHATLSENVNVIDYSIVKSGADVSGHVTLSNSTLQANARVSGSGVLERKTVRIGQSTEVAPEPNPEVY